MTASPAAFEEVAEFIASMGPRKLVAFRPSEAVQKRVDLLLEKNKTGSLTAEERSELERFLLIDHLISLAKIRAERMLRQAQAA